MIDIPIFFMTSWSILVSVKFSMNFLLTVCAFIILKYILWDVVFYFPMVYNQIHKKSYFAHLQILRLGGKNQNLLPLPKDFHANLCLDENKT